MVIDKPASMMVAPGLLEYPRAQWEHDNNRKNETHRESEIGR